MIDNNVYLMTINADGTDLKTHCSLGKFTGRPSWSYSGDSILLDGGVMCNLGTDKLTVIFDEVTIEPDISPDGRFVAYCQIDDSNNQLIFVQKIEGGDKKQLTPTPPPPSLASPMSGLVFK
jgi:Tol biopolymer transport system component